MCVWCVCGVSEQVAMHTFVVSSLRQNANLPVASVPLALSSLDRDHIPQSRSLKQSQPGCASFAQLLAQMPRLLCTHVYAVQ